MIVPVTVDVTESTTQHLGLRPSRLPPFRATAMRISHVIPGSWADLVGIQVGDFITHINGIAVSDMLTPQEFLSALSARPCKISFLLQADHNDVLVASQVAAKNRAATSTTTVNTLFDRLYGKSASSGSLFDINSFRSIHPPQASSEDSSDAEVLEIPDAVPISKQKSNSRPSDLPSSQQKLASPPHLMEALKERLISQSSSADPQTLPVIPQPLPPATSAVSGGLAPSSVSRPARKAKKEHILHAKTPTTVHVEIVQGIEVPKYAGIFASDPLWQPLSSEPFVEVFIRRVADGKIVTKKLETTVDVDCKWAGKFVLPVPFDLAKASEYVLVVLLCDYRRFTDRVVMGSLEIDFAAVPLHDPTGPPRTSVRLPVEKAVRYFDVSRTLLEIKYHIPAAAEPAQPADDADVAAADEAKEAVIAKRVEVVNEAVQTESVEEKPEFAWRVDSATMEDSDMYNLNGHIPWIYEKWHKALSYKMRMNMGVNRVDR